MNNIELAKLLIETANKLESVYKIGDYTINNIVDNNGENYYLLKYKNKIISRHNSSKDAEDEIKEREKKTNVNYFDKLIKSKEKELKDLDEREKKLRNLSKDASYKEKGDIGKELVSIIREREMLLRVIEATKSMKKRYEK